MCGMEGNVTNARKKSRKKKWVMKDNAITGVGDIQRRMALHCIRTNRKHGETQGVNRGKNCELNNITGSAYHLLCQAFLAWQHSTLCLCHQEYYALCPMGDALPKYQYVEEATI